MIQRSNIYSTPDGSKICGALRAAEPPRIPHGFESVQDSAKNDPECHFCTVRVIWSGLTSTHISYGPENRRFKTEGLVLFASLKIGKVTTLKL
jgi:hypothetical protein